MSSEKGTRRPGRTGLVAAALGFLLAAALGSFIVRSLDDDGSDARAGSTLVDPDPDPGAVLEPAVTPMTARIDYRVEIGPVSDALVSADRLIVVRPFRSRLETFDGLEPNGEPSTVEVSGFARQQAGSAATADVVLAVPPGPGTSDTRIAASLDRAVRDGRVERRELRSVVGRRCRVHRSAFPLAVSDLLPALSSEDFTDTCIDAAGLVLEELSVADGERVSRKVATRVEVGSSISDGLFETGEPTFGPEDGGGFVAELVPGSRAPGEFYEPVAPAGFELRGRFAVVPPQSENFQDETRRGERRTFVSDVFVRGPDVVVFDQGSTLGNVEPYQSLQGVEVEIDGLGPGLLTYGRGGPLVLVRLGQGRFLRARGTTSPDLLVDLLGSARPVEGGELELVDPAS